MSKGRTFEMDTVDGSALLERYHRLVELAPDAILIHDGEYVVMANSAAITLAGAASREELIGLPIEDFLNPPYLKGIESRLSNPDLEFTIPPVRDRFTRLDRTTVEVEVTAIPFLDQGRPAAHLVIRDITSRLADQDTAHKAEERASQAEKMEAVGLLAGGVAHEVNNMMVVVLGFSELLLADKRLPEHMAEDLRQIRNAGDRAAMVTSQLLAFSRRAYHHAVPVDLDRVIRDLEPTLRHLLGHHALSCIGECPDHIQFDRGQLEQALVNLATNARDAMPKGGTFTLETSIVTTAAGLMGSGNVEIPVARYARLIVTDTGVGMNPATLARIFEPFFTTKPIGKGTGLGLAAVYGVIRQNSGYIRVESTPGHGTRFALYLPLSNERAGAEWRQTPRRRVSSAPTGISILIVDDEPVVLSVSSRILEREGYTVLQAADGALALEMIAQRGPPECVVTDVMMPGIGGVELARRLRQDHPTLPVIFMSGFSADDSRWKGASILASSVLQKPFLPAALVATVAAALSTTERAHGPS
ncbi:MAG: response regulator [Gemmatimonadota bacterium]